MLIEYVGAKEQKVYGNITFDDNPEFEGRKVADVSDIKIAQEILSYGDVFKRVDIKGVVTISKKKSDPDKKLVEEVKFLKDMLKEYDEEIKGLKGRLEDAAKEIARLNGSIPTKTAGAADMFEKGKK